MYGGSSSNGYGGDKIQHQQQQQQQQQQQNPQGVYSPYQSVVDPPQQPQQYHQSYYSPTGVQQADGYNSDYGYDDQDYYGGGNGTWFEMHVVPEYPEPQTPNPITVTKFDPWEELLWVGYKHGKLTSMINPTYDRHSSFFVSKEEVKDLLIDFEGVLSLTRNSLNFHTRGGAPMFSIKNNDRFKDLNTLSYSKFDNSEIIVGSDNNSIFIIDFFTGRIIKEIMMPSAIKSINRSRGIWCGQGNGEISMLDPRTWRIEHSYPAHKAEIKSMDIKGDLLVSCGCSPRLGQIYNDPVVRVFDVKTLRSLPPIQFKRPTMVKFLPKFYSTVAILSESSNQFYLCDTLGDTNSNQFYQIDSLFGYLTSFDISTSGDIMALGDSGGLIHSWAEKEDNHINISSYPTECVQFTQLTRPTKMDESYPLTYSPFEQTQPDQYLLSYWKPTLSFTVGMPQRPINPSLLAHLKQHDFVGYITNTGISRKQIRGKAYEDGKVLKTLSNLTMSHIRPPKSYRWAPLRISKIGEEPETWENNKTIFSGIENQLSNSYSNSCIQTLYFIPYIKSTLLNHLCTKNYCLSCELGFLFNMMDKSKGKNVDTSNFVRVLKQIPQATALGICISTESPSVEPPLPLPQLVSNLNRFLLEQLHKEISSISSQSTNTSGINSPGETIIDKLFGSTLISSNKCVNCGFQYEKQSKQYQYDLVYPNSPQELGPDGSTFSNILKNTLCKVIKSPAWCEKCQGFFSTVQKKTVTSLPNILCINANCLKKEHEEYWKYESTNIITGAKTFISTPPSPAVHLNNLSTINSPSSLQSSTSLSTSSPSFNNNTSSQSSTVNNNEITWLPLKIRIKTDPQNNQFSIIEYPNNPEKSKQVFNPKELTEEVNENGQLYELTTCISHIRDQVKRLPKPGHLVTQIKVSDFYLPESKWFTFNDFKITECSPINVTHFDSNWKTASILYYSKVVPQQDNKMTIPKVVSPVTKDVYLQNSIISSKVLSFVPATADTIPQKDDLVAIDAEFVSTGPEETEVSSDGKRVIIQPGIFSLARVSMVRSNGEAFIDDYIQSIEPVTDYLTRYSGIQPGDLDPKISTKNVVTLKSCYLKMRYLVDQKVKFVGHGLKKDFRIINIYVPPEQVIDTVELFQLKNQRKLSLRFLSYILLKKEIQSETHCSIEDARTAMELYKTYLELVKNKEFDETLNKIYEIGRQYNFKVPEANNNNNNNPTTPSTPTHNPQQPQTLINYPSEMLSPSLSYYLQSSPQPSPQQQSNNNNYTYPQTPQKYHK
eukprot:gene9743-11964_t